ncbi:5'-3' exonuclease PLD3 isoform X1 [Bombus terrestris]|uniref:5'-3' exonuclease PLD3 isoform X1 n=1 Tax=Bombus terrestris TaxID=30195 RepID=A0A9C6SAA1_BOMTE|nr:5'-3' exonuclease PLD3 isoform X1 [Bombus terrestris]XP_012168666.1 5'-3' exonuclease PLD3 isoform X1 [Bombus terrestris]XP_048264924.1 5'-3' exonuclease PLD3 isoform X1 [Bombus terrestris]
MSFFAWKGSNRSENTEHGGRNLQDGLFQIASQACHILVQVNNTHNVSYGGNNNVRNIAYSKCSGNDEDSIRHTASSTSKATTSTVKSYTKYMKEQGKDQDVVVLLPHRKSRTPLVKHKLSTVSENARLELNPSKYSGSGGRNSGSGGGSGASAANCNTTAPDDDFELWDYSGFMLRNDTDDPITNGKWGGAQGWCRPSCIPITVILILIVLVVLLPLLDHAADKYASNGTNFDFDTSCMNGCNLSFVETLPIGMSYTNNTVFLDNTYDSWIKLISLAREKIEIASFYWTMRREDVYPDDSAKQGEEIFHLLLEAGRDRNILLKITQNIPSQIRPNIDTEVLTKKANAKVKSLNFAGLFGGGVLHSKLWLVDRTHLYIGSANMDWRSLSQVKELGLMALNCSCLANDFAKIFDIYWTVGNDGKIPSVWPDYLNTRINLKNPMNFTFMNNKYKTFVASSPPPFSPKGRTNDVDAILYCIEKAEKFIYISVMDYFPLTIYTAKIKYWPIIDDALRTAAIERKVHIRLLISSWKHTRKSEVFFLKSLMELTDSYAGVKIEVRKFIVPTNPDFDRIPFSRVNHNKYMVTDVTAYIGTSNWSGDYFINTAGIGTVFETIGDQTSENLRQQLENIFHRDWYSEYSYALNESIPFVKRSTNTIEDYYLRSSRYILA